jgi:DNA/RNA-binding domain of Phe-tRNA-synthetase-like protein
MDYAITISDAFHQKYPNAIVGVMIIENVSNPKKAPELDDIKTEIEQNLRENFTDKKDLRRLPIIQAYKTHYKQFKKSYHVLFQLESLIFDGRPIPNTTGLVRAMFMAELNNMLLTAGHDIAEIKFPVNIELSSDDETYTLLNGNDQAPKSGDMGMKDQEGIIASVVYGPDQRTRLKTGTKDAMFVVYAPDGINQEIIEKHFGDIFKYVSLFSPTAKQTFLKFF